MLFYYSSWRHIPRYDHGRISMFDPSLWGHWLYHLRVLATYSLLLSTGLSVFFATTFRLSYYVRHNITLHVIDQDGGPIGRQITQLLLSDTESLSRWAEARPGAGMSVDEFVRKRGWGAIVVSEGLSDRIGRPDFDPRSALTVLVASGRNPRVSMRFIQPALEAKAQWVVRSYAVQNLQSLSNGGLPIAYTTHDVAPFSSGIASVAPVLTLFVALTCTLAVQVLVKLSSHELYTSVRHLELVLLHHLLMLLWSALLALYGTLAVRAFLGPDDQAGFLYKEFAVLAGTLFACSQWLFLSLTVLPPDLFPAPFLMLVAFSSAAGLGSDELTPNVVKWIVVVHPAHCHASLFRYLASGAYPQIARDVGILVGEIVAMVLVNTVAIAVRQYWLAAGIADKNGWFRTSMFYNKPL